MNLKIFYVLYVIFVFTFPASAGVGGVSGGSKLITVEVCDLDMPGVCKKVSYVDRFTDQDRENALHPKSNCLVSMGEGDYQPCDETKTYQIPKFLKKLNEIFGGNTKAPPNYEPSN